MIKKSSLIFLIGGLLLMSGCGLLSFQKPVSICDDPDVFMYVSELVSVVEVVNDKIDSIAVINGEISQLGDDAIHESISLRLQDQLDTARGTLEGIQTFESPRVEFEVIQIDFTKAINSFRMALNGVEKALDDGNVQNITQKMEVLLEQDSTFKQLLEELDGIFSRCS